jgi:hypothetical protein
MQIYKDKKQCSRTILKYIKDHNAPPHGLEGYYHWKSWMSSLQNHIKNAADGRWEDNIHILSLYPKNFGYSLGGYSHREHWSCTRWQWITLSKKINRLPLSTNNLRLHCRQNSIDYSHRELFMIIWKKNNLNILHISIAKQGLQRRSIKFSG